MCGPFVFPRDDLHRLHVSRCHLNIPLSRAPKNRSHLYFLRRTCTPPRMLCRRWIPRTSNVGLQFHSGTATAAATITITSHDSARHHRWRSTPSSSYRFQHRRPIQPYRRTPHSIPQIQLVRDRSQLGDSRKRVHRARSPATAGKDDDRDMQRFERASASGMGLPRGWTVRTCETLYAGGNEITRVTECVVESSRR